VEPTQVVIINSEEEREKFLDLIDRSICKWTKEMDRERAASGRVTHESVEQLAKLERLRETVNDGSVSRVTIYPNP
jgi:hypothetical protein